MHASFKSLGRKLYRLRDQIGGDDFHGFCHIAEVYHEQSPLVDRWLQESRGLPDKDEEPMLRDCLDGEMYMLKICQRVAKKEKMLWSLLHVLSLSGARVARQKMITEFFKRRCRNC